MRIVSRWSADEAPVRRGGLRSIRCNSCNSWLISTLRLRPGPHPTRSAMPQKVNKKLLNAFGARVRELRTARGLSQEQLAELTGFHRTYIGMIERGERNLSLTNVSVFAKTFDKSFSELLDIKPGRGER